MSGPTKTEMSNLEPPYHRSLNAEDGLERYGHEVYAVVYDTETRQTSTVYVGCQ